MSNTRRNIIGGAVIIGCLLYYVYDYRNRKQRAIFNFIEKMWRKLKERMRGTEAVPPTTLPTTTTTDELDAEEDEEDLLSDISYLELNLKKNKNTDII